MINLTGLMGGLITVLIGLVTVYLIPWLKARLGAEKLELLAYWAGVLVSAAEQMYKGTGRGTEKLKYVEQQLAAMGFALDTARIRALIEAQVRELTAESVIIENAVEIPSNAEMAAVWQKEAPPKITIQAD